MKTLYYTLALAACMSASCTASKNSSRTGELPAFDFEGHRGARGLMPENTIPAMRKAIDMGCTTVELDVVISKDNQVVVSHDPYFNEVITTTPDGKHLSKKEAEALLLYQMPYDQIKKYDVGIKPHPGFPEQQKINVYKPLLATLIDSVEAYAKTKNKNIWYNVEIKSKEGFDGVRHPAPNEFAERLIAVLKDKGVLQRTFIQSFDVRPLQYIHRAHPSIQLSYLVEKTTTSLEEQLTKLGFLPAVYSPYHTMVTKDVVAQCHQKGMKVVPWTVNTVKEMQDLVALGVDGIISDYPNYFSQLQVSK
jgi:glycerophosphoryl diester phosphodiesterase